MKAFRFVLALAFCLCLGLSSSSTFGGPLRRMTEGDFQNLKLPLIKVPPSVTFEKSLGEVEAVTVSKKGVDYWVYENRSGQSHEAWRLWMNFMADSDGNLISFRFGRGDNHFFAWSRDVGFSEKNEARVDLKKWIAFYWTKVKFNRPIKFSEY